MKTTISDPIRFSGKVSLKNILLFCGILSSLLYIVAILIGAMRWEDYNAASQSVSELIAIDAPTAPLIIPPLIAYSILIYAFGTGIWISSGQNRILRIMALLIVAKEVFGLLVTLFAPMHLRGAEKTLSDTVHIVFTLSGTLLCMFPAMGFGASVFGKKFRYYTIGTMIIFLIFGCLAGFEGPRVAANLPTPWLGFWERINIFGYLLWIVVLSLILIRSQRSKEGVIFEESCLSFASTKTLPS